MKQYDFKYLEQLRFYYLRKLHLENIISTFPKVWIVIHNKEKREAFYHHLYVNGNRFQKYLSPKNDQPLITALQKKHNELPAIRQELAFCNSALRSMKTTAKKILAITSSCPPVTKPFFSQNTIEPKNLKYTTNRGEKVRSKSEKIIADLLYSYNIDYKYEKELKLTFYKNIFPDFTIVSPLNNQTYYWEHNGLTSSEYLEHWRTKEQVYKNNNITTEENIDNFKNIIEQTFTLKRYDFIYHL